MRSQIPKTNCKWKDEGPSDLNADVWPEVWEFKILQRLTDGVGYY